MKQRLRLGIVWVLDQPDNVPMISGISKLAYIWLKDDDKQGASGE